MSAWIDQLSQLLSGKVALDGKDANGQEHDTKGRFGTGGGTAGSEGATPGKSFADYRKEAGGDHYKAAQAFYKNELMGKPAKTQIDGKDAEVHFAGGKDRKKMWQDIERDPVRAEALQHTRGVIESGKYLGKAASSKDDDRFVSYHYFQKEIPMKDGEGKPRKLIVDVGKKKDGAMEYRAHNFVHNKEPHYGKKVVNLRNAGIKAEDRAIKKTGSILRHGYSRPNQKNEPPASGQTIANFVPRVNPDRVSFDAATARHFDENGFLHVALCHISKEQVADYYGHEIPGWQEFGLDPNRVYHGYRPGPELAKAAATFNGLPLLSEHVKDSAEDPQKEFRVGSLGTDAAFRPPYLDNALIIQDAAAIEALNPKAGGQAAKRELSASYRYDPLFKPGVFAGQRYDFVMTNIRGNHVALVEEGRAGSDVMVADQNTIKQRGESMDFIEALKALVAKYSATPPDNGEGNTPAVSASPPDGQAQAQAQAQAQDDEGGEVVAKISSYLGGMEDQDLAGKVKEIVQAALAASPAPAAGDDGGEAPPATDEGGAPDNKKEDATAMDKNPGKQPTPPKAKDKPPAAGPIRVMAMDTNAVAAQIRAAFKEQIEAARDVRPLIGEVDPLAFDSAADIYGKALSLIGRPTKLTDARALKELCALARDAKREKNPFPVISSLASDSKEDDPLFVHLVRIRKA